MKNLSKVCIGISSLFLLIGCDNKKEKPETVTQITEKEFATKLAGSKEVTYLSATVHATERIVGTGDFAQNRNEERTEVYTHYTDTDAWIVEDGDSLLRKYVYKFDTLMSFKAWVQDEELSYSYKYYSDLSVEIKETGTYVDEMMGVTKTVDINSSMKIKINEHGYLTKLDGTYQQNIVQVSGDTTYRGTKNGESMIEISYR